MKKLALSLIAVAAICLCVAPLALVEGCQSPTAKKVEYQTLAGLESAVTGAHNGYLDSVVIAFQAGNFSATNSVPEVSQAFNDTQLAIHTAAVIASGGTNAPAPAAVQAKGNSFIALVNARKPH